MITNAKSAITISNRENFFFIIENLKYLFQINVELICSTIFKIGIIIVPLCKTTS